jgi:DNA-binding response OmpR family regulator
MGGTDARLGDMRAEWDRLGRQHIFVVNSDPAILDLLRTLLQEERYNVTTTNYVPRTFNQIVALRPDLLIANLTPREFSGWDLLERLHGEALTRQIPVVVTSTNPEFLAHARRHSELYGQASYVVLPFDVDALLAPIHRLIGAAEPDGARP